MLKLPLLRVTLLFYVLHFVSAIPDYDDYKFEENIEVSLSVGKVVGNKNIYTHDSKSYDVAEFLGIPFAEPPLGSNRFKRPFKLDALPEDPFEATKFGPGCRQNLDLMFADENVYDDNLRTGSYMWNVYDQSEDCLTLNVWAPYENENDGDGNTNDADLKPVMLWIFGGGFYSGASNLDVYLGYRLAALEDVVVVNFNYRVGVLGFLQLDDVEGSGNQGLYDQLMVMEWVRDHIRFFGGDPNRVTLFGESAGGASVGFHILSKPSQGLFHKAILQSGSPTAPWALNTEEEMSRRVETIKNYVENNDLCEDTKEVKSFPFTWLFYNKHFSDKDNLGECLQSLPADKVLEIELNELWTVPMERYMVFPIGPVVDGELIAEDPRAQLERGDFANIPIMAGSNRNEGIFFLLYFLPDFFNDFKGDNFLDSTQYEKAMEAAYGTSPVPTAGLATFYYRDYSDLENGEKNRIAVDDATGAENFICPVNELANYLSKAHENWPEAHDKNTVHMYSLHHRAEAEVWPEWMGVIHGADCEWVFGKFLDHPDSTTEEVAFNRKIQSHWANFARYSDPNVDNSFNVWPEWTSSEQKTQFLDVDSELEKMDPITVGPRANQCGLWNDYLPEIKNIVDDSFVDGAVTTFEKLQQKWARKKDKDESF